MSDGPPLATMVFAKAISEHLEVMRQLAEQQPLLESIARAMVMSLKSGGKILWCGNGGSAADCQHLAAEMVGRFRRERIALPSIALTTDTSILTALANDYGYETVFARQIEALGNRNDMLVGISTSGNSANVVRALACARDKGLITVAFTGIGGGKMAGLADHLLAIASRDTARIQEAHTLAGHMLCDWVELQCLEMSERTTVSAAEHSGALL